MKTQINLVNKEKESKNKRAANSIQDIKNPTLNILFDYDILTILSTY